MAATCLQTVSNVFARYVPIQGGYAVLVDAYQWDICCSTRQVNSKSFMETCMRVREFSLNTAVGKCGMKHKVDTSSARHNGTTGSAFES